MKAFARGLLFIFGLMCSATAQDASVRTKLEQSDLWTGQRTTLVIELLAPGYFSGSPSFDLPEVPGLLLIPPTESATVSREDVNGVTDTVQRYEFFVMAQRAGNYAVPPFAIRLAFKRNPLDEKSISQTVKTAAVPIVAKQPPGAEQLGSILSTTNLTATEVWKPESTHAKVGDALTRTITFTAINLPGMAFPPFPQKAIAGLGIYPKPPQVHDTTDRGDLEGSRIETVVYVCERTGHFTIPAASITWWNLSTLKLETIDFPERNFDVAANPAFTSGSEKVNARVTIPWSVIVAILALLGILVVIAATRNRWLPTAGRAIETMRPMHLQPLNPQSSLHEN